MEHVGINTRLREPVLTLCFPQGVPGIRQHKKAAKNKDVAQDMKYIEMWVAFQAEQGMN